MERARFGVWREGMRYLLYDLDIPGDLLSLWTNPASGKALPRPHERGTVVTVEAGGGEYVLRHYFRGGYPSRWSRDRYLWTGFEHSRPWREFVLLGKLRRQGLPVPAPTLACVERGCLSYRADLVTSRLSGMSLAQSMDAGTAINWLAIGRTIRRFHDAGIDHVDLNMHNIFLVDEGRIYLLDFDRAREHRQPGAWGQRNLSRLRRSLTKGGDRPEFEASWATLLEGYHLEG